MKFRSLKSIPQRFLKLFLLVVLAVPSSAVGAPQSSQDDLYNQAVQEYGQNQFSPALEKFQKITGPHAQDAQRYIAAIKAYTDAMSAAKGIMDRSPDEQDANSLQYAIEKLQAAIKIKPDGPWQPAQLLQKAQALKAQIVQQRAAGTAARDRDFCAKAVGAAAQHRYKEAALYICPVANDNPAYACGGDEAVHMCEQMNDLAKLEKGTHPSSDEHRTGSASASSAGTGAGSTDSKLERAKAYYEKNDFQHAQAEFRKVSGDMKPSANEYLDKISRYQDAMTQGNQATQNSKYEDAETAFRNAASIKPDGPGAPQTQALLMELMIGLDQFYSGDYVSATGHLEAYARESTDRQALVHFYLGASKLARFFLSGGDDAKLRNDALNDLKLAKQAGFKTTGQDVSPKILQAYNDLTF